MVILPYKSNPHTKLRARPTDPQIHKPTEPQSHRATNSQIHRLTDSQNIISVYITKGAVVGLGLLLTNRATQSEQVNTKSDLFVRTGFARAVDRLEGYVFPGTNGVTRLVNAMLSLTELKVHARKYLF